MPSSDGGSSGYPDLATLFGDGQVQDPHQPQQLILPPPNFGMVDWGIYRSSYPAPENLPFLKKLRLRSIVYLCMEPYLHADFIAANDIRLFQFGIEGKCGDVAMPPIPEHVIRGALKVVLDVDNYPLLIHCNRGKHRTGVLVGCYRKVQKWSLASVLDEYDRYAGVKARLRDKQFIEAFDASGLQRKGHIWKAISWWLRAFCDGHTLQPVKTFGSMQDQQHQHQQQEDQHLSSRNSC